MTDPRRYIEGPDEVDDDAESKLPLDHDARKVDEAEIERRYGRLEDKAADIARVVFDGRASNSQTEAVFQLLKKMAPYILNAESAHTRRYDWTQREKANGGKAPKYKAKVTNHELGAPPEVPKRVYTQAQLVIENRETWDPPQPPLTLWDFVNWSNGKNVPKLYSKDGRVISRDMLRAMKPFLIEFAKENGFDQSKMSTEFRRASTKKSDADDEFGDDTGGDDMKPIEELTQMKRLLLLTARVFFEGFGPEDFFR